MRWIPATFLLLSTCAITRTSAPISLAAEAIDETRVRMRSDWDCSTYSTSVQLLCDDLKESGLPIPGTGVNWHLSGSSSRWSEAVEAELDEIPREAFEVVHPLTW